VYLKQYLCKMNITEPMVQVSHGVLPMRIFVLSHAKKGTHIEIKVRRPKICSDVMIAH
jgi:hypothetical protein